jgi:hypothetical protein
MSVAVPEMTTDTKLHWPETKEDARRNLNDESLRNVLQDGDILAAHLVRPFRPFSPLSC